VNWKLSAVCARSANRTKNGTGSAQAAKYQVQASQKIAFRFEKPATVVTPEVKLEQWSHGRDERRSMEALPLERRTG
jgi:hypothetical protein